MMNAIPIARVAVQSGTQPIAIRTDEEFHLPAMSIPTITLFAALFSAAGLLSETDIGRLAGSGIIGILAGASLGILKATSASNTIPAEVWLRRFFSYFLGGVVAGPLLLVFATHFGLESSVFLSFGCGGLGGFAGLGLVMVGERKVKQMAERSANAYSDNEEDEELPSVPPGKPVVIRQQPPTTKLV